MDIKDRTAGSSKSTTANQMPRWKYKQISEIIVFVTAALYGFINAILRANGVTDNQIYLAVFVVHILVWVIAWLLKRKENNDLEERLNSLSELENDNEYLTALTNAQQGLAGIISDED